MTTVPILGCDFSALNTNDHHHNVRNRDNGAFLNDAMLEELVALDLTTTWKPLTATSTTTSATWNPTELTRPFAEGRWNPLSTGDENLTGGKGGRGRGESGESAIDNIAKFTPYKKGSPLLRTSIGSGDVVPLSSRVELLSQDLPLESLNLVVAPNKKNNVEINKISEKSASEHNPSFAEKLLTYVFAGYTSGESRPKEDATEVASLLDNKDGNGMSKCRGDLCCVEDDGDDFWSAQTGCKAVTASGDVQDYVNPGESLNANPTPKESFHLEALPPEIDGLPKALIMKSFKAINYDSTSDESQIEFIGDGDGSDFLSQINMNNNSSSVMSANSNNNSSSVRTRQTNNNGQLNSINMNNNSNSIMSMMNDNDNNESEADPTARFRSFTTNGVGPMSLYQPSAISAQVDRQGPIERYQYQRTNQCRVGGGPPGIPAAGGYHSSRPATKEGIPWGTRKDRRRQPKAINQEPYQTLKPSGNWMHGTKQKQPANKQAQATRVMAYPYYLPENQKCHSRPEYRSRQAATGLTGSCNDVKLKKEIKVDLEKVRCNCPGLYPEHSSHGPGNFWDEEDDDEAILAGMCSDDIEEECGQGQDGLFPLEEWADEWEDGITSGECIKGRLAPGTLELRPWENPCLEELHKRKRRIQDLRNKRWAAIAKAKDAATRLQQDSYATEEQKKAAVKKMEQVFNENSQKSWSLLGWFNPTNWASSGGSGCGEPEINRPAKTTTIRSNRGAPAEMRGSTPALREKNKDVTKCCTSGNNKYGDNTGKKGDNKCSSNTNKTGINGVNKCGSSASAYNKCRNNDVGSAGDEDDPIVDANSNDNNSGIDDSNLKSFDDNSPLAIREKRAKRKNTIPNIDEYEWECLDDSPQEYHKKVAASGIKSRNDVKERILKMEVEQAKRKRKTKQAQEAKRLREAANGAGLFASIWGFFTGTSTEAGKPVEPIKTIKANNDTNANISANNDTTLDGNANNNAANRCARACPPCPQKDCEPPPFECPCNDVSCPKKLKPKNDNMEFDDVTSAGTTVNIKRGDNNVVDINIDLKKPKPDLALGCPCGDETCKKKFCNQPQPEPAYDICQLAKGPMTIQKACPDPEERDICDDPDEAPKNCPCEDEHCPNKPGGDGYFRFLYPPNDKMKFDDDGCPAEQQIECFVMPNGQVRAKPILSPLHCAVVPPCPCEDWEKMEFDSCDCSGNWWGEEADDETLDEGECGEPGETDDECGHQQVPGGLGKVDEYEWDQEDIPCVDIPEDADEEDVAAAEARKQCNDYMEYRSKKTGILQAAMDAALDAWKVWKAMKEKEKDQLEARKRKIQAYRNEGLDDEEIYDLMCVITGGQCDIVGDYPVQSACQPAPNDPPGCPCPDPKCPKRALFDHTMFDKDMDKYKTKKDKIAAERYYKSDAYKTMECELKAPTYKDVGKGYPKAKRCPCPECKEEDQKAWAEVELMKVGPPPECPCKDIKCPKKPPKEEQEEKMLEDSPCHMRGRYPKQSGCLDIIRCDLIKDPCNDLCVRPEDKKPPPKEEFRCHACSLRTPMPKQSSCPDYECDKCSLVCDDCGCKPTKCEKCESEKPVVVQEEILCPPCTVPRPMPKQSSCKELHPCDPAHPCMCDPGTGEPVDAERCGPCDTRNHQIYPDQTDCPLEEHPEAEICDSPEEKAKIKALQDKRLKTMKLIDTRTGFGLLEGQATITCETDESGNCKQGDCESGFSELTINLSDATKARLMPGNPATEGVVEGRGGKFLVDKNKAKELEEKKKAVEEAHKKCVRVIEYEASANDSGIIDTEDKKTSNIKPNKSAVKKAVKNFRNSMSTMSLDEQLEEDRKAFALAKKTATKRVKDKNNNSEDVNNKDVIDVEAVVVDVDEDVEGSKKQNGLVIAVNSQEEAEEVKIAAAAEEAMKELEKLVAYSNDSLKNQDLRELKTNRQQQKQQQQQQQPKLPTPSDEEEAEENCMKSCLFTGLDSPNIVVKKKHATKISDVLPSEMRPKMKCRERHETIKSVMGLKHHSSKDKPPGIELSDSDIEDEVSKPSRHSRTGLFGARDESGWNYVGTLERNASSSGSWASSTSASTSGLGVVSRSLSAGNGGVFHRAATLEMNSRSFGANFDSGVTKARKPAQELFLVETDENGAKILGSVDYAELECHAKRKISDQFSESAAQALDEGSVGESVKLLSQAILSHPEPKSFLERLGIRNFLPKGLWSSGE